MTYPPPGTTNSPVACDFENGYCSYEDMTGYDDFDWKRWQGSTPSWNTGPSVDHTTGTSSGTQIHNLCLPGNSIYRALYFS